MQGIVMRSTGLWYEVLTDDKSILKCRVRGKLKLLDKKVTNPIAVGDYVDYEIENSTELTGIITEVLPRDNYIVRKSVHKTAHAHVLAANLDQAILIVTLTFPRTSLGFIDRFLVTAEAFEIPAKVVFNKIDLFNAEELEYLQEIKQIYEDIGYPCLLTSTLTGEGIEDFRQWLQNQKSLLSGHSGVGKSSLVNLIAPDLQLKTSIRTATNR
ncbi:MAG: ribosome small subunit-dependent GTPase A [Microscillaceae bacterium]|nr:ribosome small subunit-dependent GTPase A [Microscillaceae bacterium]